jgi:F0F1-type ATP synthase membrane subunit a
MMVSIASHVLVRQLSRRNVLEKRKPRAASPISSGVRLFANMTAGHSLLAIIAGFGWSSCIRVSLLRL